jgi:hypothetical protein
LRFFNNTRAGQQFVFHVYRRELCLCFTHTASLTFIR